MRLLQLGLTLASATLMAVVAYVAWRVRRRLRRLRTPQSGWLTNGMIRQIVMSGEIEGPDPPLDLKAIGREEDRFWAETWDEPEPYQD